MVDKGSFYGKGVKSHFKALEKSDDNILSAFSSFGETSAVTEEIMPQMERYICLLYGSSTEKTIQGIYIILISHFSCHFATTSYLSYQIYDFRCLL